jgi:hypothetical protein
MGSTESCVYSRPMASSSASKAANTPSSLLLRSDHPMTMRAFAQMTGVPFTWGSLTEFKHSS